MKLLLDFWIPAANAASYYPRDSSKDLVGA